MTRQITITLDGVQYMVDVDIQREPSGIVYHVSTPQHFREELPEHFDILKPEDTDQPRYSTSSLKGKGKKVADAIWEELNALAPQFKGDKA